MKETHDIPKTPIRFFFHYMKKNWIIALPLFLIVTIAWISMVVNTYLMKFLV